nr:hypothetical protein [Pseudomonas aeruginosa]
MIYKTTNVRLLRWLRIILQSVLITIVSMALLNLVAFAKVPRTETSVASWYSQRFPETPLIHSIVDKAWWVILVWVTPVGSDYIGFDMKASMLIHELEKKAGNTNLKGSEHERTY